VVRRGGGYMTSATKTAATKARASPIAAISANPRDSFGELELDGLQLGLCDILGLFIRCAARTENRDPWIYIGRADESRGPARLKALRLSHGSVQTRERLSALGQSHRFDRRPFTSGLPPITGHLQSRVHIIKGALH
jgi:hypothetical protein